MSETAKADAPKAVVPPKKGGLIPDGKGGRRWVSYEEHQAYLKSKAEVVKPKQG